MRCRWVNYSLCAILSLLGWLTLVDGSTYYISPSGSTSLPCGGSTTSPCNSVFLVFSSLPSNPTVESVTIVAASGNYSVQSTTSFSNQALTLISANTASPASFFCASGITFLAASNGTLELSSVAVSGCTQAVLLLASTFTIHNSNFSHNSAPSPGGAIYCATEPCSGVVKQSLFFNNTANVQTASSAQTQGGGAICIQGSLSIEESYFIANAASNLLSPQFTFLGGGAVVALQVSISGSYFSQNSVQLYSGSGLASGGAVNIVGTGVNAIQNSVFLGNTVTNSIGNVNGGAIAHSGSSLTLTNCSLSGNAVYSLSTFVSSVNSIAGGAVFSTFFTYITSSQFTNNSVVGSGSMTSGSGGAVSAGVVVISQSLFVGNSVIGTTGGAVYISIGNAQFMSSVTDSNFTGNYITGSLTATASIIGGGAIGTLQPLNVTNSVFVGCFVQQADSAAVSNQGGAIASSTTVFLANSQFLNNHVGSANSVATNAGGALWAVYVFVSNSVFTNNVALSVQSCNGGAVTCQTMLAVDSMFSNNEVNLAAPGFSNQLNELASGGALIIYSNGAIVNCEFTSNRILGENIDVSKGGAVASPLLTVIGCNFLENYVGNFASSSSSGTAYGGALSVEDGTVIDSNFVGNSATVQTQGYVTGGAVAFISGSISGCIFVGNSATSSSLEYSGTAIGGAVSFDSLAGSSVIPVVVNCVFVGNMASIAATSRAYGGALFAPNPVLVSGCNFTGNYAISSADFGGSVGGAIHAYDLILTNSVFLSNYLKVSAAGPGQGGAIYASTADISNCSFVNNYANCQGDGVSCLGGTLFADLLSIGPQTAITGSRLYGGARSLVIGGSIAASELTMSGCTVSNSSAVGYSGDLLAGGVAFSQSVHISDCIFVENTLNSLTGSVNYGGAVSWAGYSSSASSFFDGLLSPTAFISNSNFSYCTVTTTTLTGNGGCIASPSISAQNTNFLEGYGDNGGSIYLSATVQYPVQYPSVLLYTTFTSSGASLGGALFLVTTEIALSNVVFFGCSADDGAAIYMQASSVLVPVSQFLPAAVTANISFIGNYAQAGAALFWDNTGPIPSFPASTTYSQNFAYYGSTLASFPVAQEITTIGCAPPIPGCELELQLYLVDGFDNLLQFLPGTEGTYQITTQDLCIPPVIGELSGVVAENIQLATSQLRQPIQLVVTTDVIVQNQFTNVTHLDLGYFDTCPRGEILTTIASSHCLYCQTCALSTYSLFESDTDCHSCASAEGEAQCQGSNVIATRGWWLYVNNASRTVEAEPCPSEFCATATNMTCLNSMPLDKCLSVFAASQNSQIYNGSTLYCDTSDVPGKANGWCAPLNLCAKNRKGFMCSDCISDEYSEWNGKCIDCSNPQKGLLALVVLGYWLETVVLYMLLSNKASVATKILIYFVQVALLIATPSDSLSVALAVLNINLSTASSVCLFRRSFFEAFLQQVFVLPLVIFTQLVIGFGVIALIQKLRKEKVDYVRWFVRPLIAMILALYTPVSTQVLKMLNCQSLGGFYVLSAAPSYLCQGSIHLPYFIIALVMTGTFIVAVPVWFAIVLYRSRLQLEKEDVKAKVGYLYEAYSLKYYWWEITVLVRRTILSALSITLTSTTRSIALSLICTLAAFSQYYTNPNVDELSNRIEFASLLALVFLTVLNTGFFNAAVDQNVISILQDVLIAGMALFLLAFAVYMSRVMIVGVLRQIRMKLFGESPKGDPWGGAEMSPLEELLVPKDSDL